MSDDDRAKLADPPNPFLWWGLGLATAGAAVIVHGAGMPQYAKTAVVLATPAVLLLFAVWVSRWA